MTPLRNIGPSTSRSCLRWLPHGLWGLIGLLIFSSQPLGAQNISEQTQRIARLATTGYTLTLDIPMKEVRKNWKRFLGQVAKPRLSKRHWKVYFGEKPHRIILYTTIRAHKKSTLVYLGTVAEAGAAEKITHYRQEIHRLLDKFAVVAMKQHLEKQLIAREQSIRKDSKTREQMEKKVKKIRAQLAKDPTLEKATYELEIRKLQENIQTLSQQLEEKQKEKAQLMTTLTRLGK